MKQFTHDLCNTPRRLHRDERGTISVLTLPVLIGLVMLIGMLINVGRHIDDKIKAQNAADAAVFSGTVEIARGMNGLAFTNHLLCDMLALTAVMREARDRHVDPLIPAIHDAWKQVGRIMERSPFPKFATLGQAIPKKIPLERTVISTFSGTMGALSGMTLPVLEQTLADQLIPKFQRALVVTVAGFAQQMTRRIAEEHGTQPAVELARRGQLGGILWDGSGLAVGTRPDTDPFQRTLPVIDPDPLNGRDYPALGQDKDNYLTMAIQQRDQMSRQYLEQWNSWNNPNTPYDDMLQFFDQEVKMSQFSNLWRVFSCGQLERLLTVDYPLSNLPHLLRFTDDHLPAQRLVQSGSSAAMNEYVDRFHMFVGVVYRRPMRETLPGLFKNPLTALHGNSTAYPLAFSQATLFLPVRQHQCCPWAHMVWVRDWETGRMVPRWIDHFNNWPHHWDLWNQNWTVQLVPATSDAVPQILQTPLSPQFGQTFSNYQPPNLGPVTPADLRRVNTH